MDSEQSPKESALMTYAEYEKIHDEKPYLFQLESGGNRLFYFGENHSFDPDDQQWKAVKSFWQEFLKKTEGRNRIAFVEGGERPLSSSEKESIEKNGGMGLLTYLAHQEGIETYSPEPSERKERAELEKQFSREQIQYYYFAQMAYQWERKQDPKPDFDTYMRRALKSDERQSGWSDFDFSLERMRQVHIQLFGTPFDPGKKNFWNKIVNPAMRPTVLNGVARASSRYRDEHIVNEIVKYMKDGHSIFAEYGGTHVVMQEPLLRALLKA
ncbi:hypothetical protein HY091_02795 [Candidatus Kaiserbacteria bacterium]|nr:hypothetical protein [Candidatus Kaiserbacteria bacterium]